MEFCTKSTAVAYLYSLASTDLQDLDEATEYSVMPRHVYSAVVTQN